MYEEEFPVRLAKLRLRKGVSARDMSLSLGQNAGYINNIETGKALPSMSAFFFICEFLNISPQEFFDVDAQNPEALRRLIGNIKKLDLRQFESLVTIVEGLTENRKTM